MAGERFTPNDVTAIRRELTRILEITDDRGRRVADAKRGIYAFYDYDDEPIYVGQTAEQLRVRIRRHLTNRRTDAAAMFVLDPFEVLRVEMWPFWDLAGKTRATYKPVLDRAESTVYYKVLNEAKFHAVLNEAPIAKLEFIELPTSYGGPIVPEGILEERKQSDVRIARRAATIANLAEIIRERAVSPGLRRTLLTQVKRLAWLAEKRLAEVEAASGEEGADDEESEGGHEE